MATKFPLGRLMITSNAQHLLNQIDISRCLIRHMHGDWGELGTADKAENDFALKEGFRLLSAYHDRNKIKFWIITEADRSVTTVLLPDDY